MQNPDKFFVKNDSLQAGSVTIQVGSDEWYEWLSVNKKFSFGGQTGQFIAQCEKRRNSMYWYAYRRREGKLNKVYLGKSEELTAERLERANVALAGEIFLTRSIDQTEGEYFSKTESRIDTSFLPMTKVNAPVLPQKLVTRLRLTGQINTPLTLIYAPSGFGKSTLLNDWKQACDHPVAWLTLDENDNRAMRFWYSVVLALQNVHADFGKELLTDLSTVSGIQLSEIVLRLTNSIVHCSASFPKISLILDDFHFIDNTEIYESVQFLLEHFPSTLQLIISGKFGIPLSLGHLRGKGLLTELDANDLRFTMEEGIQYLQQYPQEPPLAHEDLEKLVKHTEGWAAGLTLTALALGKQKDRRQFIDTFSGAHTYLRDYFMETVLQRSTPEVQSFLLKTAILKQLTGSLCDALTGQTNSAEILSRLWQENLFIIRLDQEGWYRHIELFAEMLCSQLQTRFSNEIPELHRRAARWYREQYAPADAIYHLLAADEWEEAASVMEEMALRELEYHGEDSRLLRWLQELPESVVQKHKTLLFVYLRLANVALPEKKIESFIAKIEANLNGKTSAERTRAENDVLLEIQQIRHPTIDGSTFRPPLISRSKHDRKWDVLNGLHLLRFAYNPNPEPLEKQMANLLHVAEVQRNLFVILMAGGMLARRVLINGHLRQSEKIARQVLQQALTQRGKLPEPTSIALGTLAQVYLERNELELAEKYLAQIVEVDPNPTSSNMPIQTAIIKAKIQAAEGRVDQARATLRDVRDLHVRRPSGLWNDQDLIAYEALVCVRQRDISSAEQLLSESGNDTTHPLSQLVWAEILLGKKQCEAAEQQLSDLIEQFPYGIQHDEPLMSARILLALALFEQRKMNQARHAIAEAIRLAAPEKFIRPFLEHGTSCVPLLTLVLHTENLTNETRSFIKGILRLVGHDFDKNNSLPQEYLDLSAAASITRREQEILQMLATGLGNGQIATQLSISESTVKTHLGNIYAKLNVNSRVQALAQAQALKLV